MSNKNITENSITCHCGDTALRYYTRELINKHSMTVIRCFYRCFNCWSRHSKDFIPELDKMERVNVFDLINKK